MDGGSSLRDNLKKYLKKKRLMETGTHLKGVVEVVVCNWAEVYGLREKSDPLIDLSAVL